MFISLEQKWNGQFHLLFLTKLRNESKGVVKYLVVHFYEEHREEVLKMFSVEHQELAESIHWTSEGKNPRAVEKMAQDTIDEQPFS